MKVRVHYTKMIEEVLEVDDKFKQLTPDELDNLDTDEVNELIVALGDAVSSKIDPDYLCLTYIEDCDTGEVIYEN